MYHYSKISLPRRLMAHTHDQEEEEEKRKDKKKEKIAGECVFWDAYTGSNHIMCLRGPAPDKQQ